MFVAIAEDDPIFAHSLQNHLQRFAGEQGIALRTSVFSSGTALLDAYQPEWDLILLDIEMPLMDGTTAAKRIRERDDKILIMFITSFAQFAINGYEVSALDYVLKPLHYPMFCAKMKRIQSLLQNHQSRSIIATFDGKTKRLALDQLYYVEVFNHTLTYHTPEGTFSATGSHTITKLEKELTSDSFFRCNNCYLVNLKYVVSIDKDSICMSNGKILPISRSRRKEFMNALMRYWGG